MSMFVPGPIGSCLHLHLPLFNHVNLVDHSRTAMYALINGSQQEWEMQIPLRPTNHRNSHDLLPLIRFSTVLHHTRSQPQCVIACVRRYRENPPHDRTQCVATVVTDRELGVNV